MTDMATAAAAADTARTLAGLGPYLTILVAAALPTHVWRVLGVLLAGRLREETALFAWVKAVATALVAAVIAELILFPTGEAAAIPTWARLGAVAAGFAVFLAAGRRLVIGILVAEGLLIAAWFALVPA